MIAGVTIKIKPMEKCYLKRSQYSNWIQLFSTSGWNIFRSVTLHLNVLLAINYACMWRKGYLPQSCFISSGVCHVHEYMYWDSFTNTATGSWMCWWCWAFWRYISPLQIGDPEKYWVLCLLVCLLVCWVFIIHFDGKGMCAVSINVLM